MDTTNTDIPALVASLRGLLDLITSGVLQMQQSKDEAAEEADWLYSRLIWHEMTPSQIAEQVPGVDVLA